MKNKKVLVIGSLILILIIVIILILSTGGKREDVYLQDFKISSNGTKMTLKVGVTSSAGYIRKIKRTSGSMNYYYTFYSTYGINSKFGAKDTFQIDIDKSVDEIYFYAGNGGYKKVLEKDELGNWEKVLNSTFELKNVTSEIFDISLTGATIVITDKNKKPYTYGAWYKIEKENDGIWNELKPNSENYGFNEMGYLPNANGELKFIMDWEAIYGKLDYGSYRIVKKINDNYIYIPFNIATTF